MQQTANSGGVPDISYQGHFLVEGTLAGCARKLFWSQSHLTFSCMGLYLCPFLCSLLQNKNSPRIKLSSSIFQVTLLFPRCWGRRLPKIPVACHQNTQKSLLPLLANLSLVTFVPSLSLKAQDLTNEEDEMVGCTLTGSSGIRQDLDGWSWGMLEKLHWCEVPAFCNMI